MTDTPFSGNPTPVSLLDHLLHWLSTHQVAYTFLYESTKGIFTIADIKSASGNVFKVRITLTSEPVDSSQAYGRLFCLCDGDQSDGASACLPGGTRSQAITSALNENGFNFTECLLMEVKTKQLALHTVLSGHIGPRGLESLSGLAVKFPAGQLNFCPKGTLYW
ncbi:hypothetical protein K432DRAFT_388265 [Lepidopterella palustris CBS 459.81]|uniref:Uncharacterized protein n=1 Tax=Lepidopterella palustris CBS 459.81 TaxID=1314670 RepID=A0A8E2JKJ8_9PEZI|nr:hypothetical protein K432DRAFT_388265 [Lepidopterella palustris CBS 459.81]